MDGQLSAGLEGATQTSMPLGSVSLRPSVPERFGVIATLLEPRLLLAFAHDNVRRLILMFLGLCFAGLAVWWLVPPKYAATALVMVDPREQRVTKDSVVLPSFGKDDVALESLVEIAKSDGFLDTLLSRPDFRGIKEFSAYHDVSQLLEHVRHALTISRRGLTYVISVTFTAGSAMDAARVANMVAEAFVQSQGAVHADAASQATDWLGSRTQGLRDDAQKSDAAVADYKARQRLAELSDQTTIRQYRVADLNRKVTQARQQAEEAEARYNQAQREMATGGYAGLRSEVLDTLRLQRTQTYDVIAQKRAVFGNRHPELTVLNQRLAETNRQIEREGRSIVEQVKSERDTSQAYLKALESQERQLEGELIATENAEPELKQRQIEAAANQTIFNQFLSRFKLTNELRWLRSAEVSFVSKAEPPLHSTAPPLRMILLILGLAAAVLSLTVAMIGDVFRRAR
jgi:uncharacterized protein involved in exopolysaccharide biosynthesis